MINGYPSHGTRVEPFTGEGRVTMLQIRITYSSRLRSTTHMLLLRHAELEVRHEILDLLLFFRLSQVSTIFTYAYRKVNFHFLSSLLTFF